MKTALCLHGLSSGKSDKGDSVDYLKGFNTTKEHILNVNNTDVFIHSWSEDKAHTQEIKNLYSPIYSIFEKQILFSPSADSFLPPPQHDNEHNPQRKYHYVSSRWYSHKKSLVLKKKYEKENNFKYDFVMTGRFDVSYFSSFNFGAYDPRYFYSPNDYGEPEKRI